MDREEMIEILIQDRIWDWVYAQNTDGLREALRVGYEGWENYTTQELSDAIERISDKVDMIKEMLSQIKSEAST